MDYETCRLESFQTSRLTQVLIANIVESLFQKQHYRSRVRRLRRSQPLLVGSEGREGVRGGAKIEDAG